MSQPWDSWGQDHWWQWQGQWQGKGTGSRASGSAGAKGRGKEGKGKEGKGKGEGGKNKVSRPGQGARHRGRQEPLEAPEAGEGTQGGLGGVLRNVALDENLWASLTPEVQQNLIRLGRLQPYSPDQMVRIPWPDVWWKTFPDRDHAWGIKGAKGQGREVDIELKVRFRQQQGRTTLTMLGPDRDIMGTFLEVLLQECEAAHPEQPFHRVRTYLAQHPDLFAADVNRQSEVVQASHLFDFQSNAFHFHS